MAFFVARSLCQEKDCQNFVDIIVICLSFLEYFLTLEKSDNPELDCSSKFECRFTGAFVEISSVAKAEQTSIPSQSSSSSWLLGFSFTLGDRNVILRLLKVKRVQPELFFGVRMGKTRSSK